MFKQRDWTTAKSFCIGMNMKLATVTSAVQHSYLASKSSPYILGTNQYWTCGRDSNIIQQFVWEQVWEGFFPPVEQFGGFINPGVKTGLTWLSTSTGYLVARDRKSVV